MQSGSDLQEGRSIYSKGRSISGPTIRLRMGTGGPLMPAASFACKNCHGEFGEGTDEGGLQPPTLLWKDLMKARTSEFTHRRRSAYNDESLKAAFRAGVNSVNEKLHPGMPRYQMTDSQATALLAYLRVLGTEKTFDRGLSKDSIKLGCIVPPKNSSAHDDLKSALVSYFDKINTSGGLYGRKIEMKFAEVSAQPNSMEDALANLVDEENVFALISCSPWMLNSQNAEMLQSSETPVLGPLLITEKERARQKPTVFHILASLETQARVLIDHAANQDGTSKKLEILYDSNYCSAETIKNLRQHANNQGFSVSEHSLDENVDRSIHEVTNSGLDWLLYLAAPEHLASVSRGLQESSSTAGVLALSTTILQMRSQLSPQMLERSVLSFAAPLPEAQWIHDMRAKAAEAGTAPGHLAMQWTAQGAADLFMEAAKLCGRKLSRQALVRSLESMHRYETSKLLPLTFGPNRRVGPSSAYLGFIDVSSGRIRIASQPSTPGRLAKGLDPKNQGGYQ